MRRAPGVILNNGGENGGGKKQALHDGPSLGVRKTFVRIKCLRHRNAALYRRLCNLCTCGWWNTAANQHEREVDEVDGKNKRMLDHNTM